MSDTDPIDLDTLTDDEVLKLGPDQINALMEQESSEESANAEPATPDDATDAEGDPDKVEDKADAEPDKKDDKAKKDDAPKADDPKVAEAVSFFEEITKPFKADGKDFQVKTAGEAIRLMQMGANYSRRMQEMKPLRAQDAVLKEHGLDDPKKLAQLIDISKGDPAAIQKLLKEKGIDPLDIDVSKDSTYDGNKVYSADEKNLAFKDAITSTLEAPGGRELITDMNATWDEESKNALYEKPQIFENLLDQKSSGDYEKVVAELQRQRVLCYLTDVPFLQAYTDVSNAMENLGLVGSKKTTPEAKAPIDTGTRKAAPKPKTEQPNPNLSSTPKPAAPSNTGGNKEIDYSTLSDEEFLKLGAPG